MKLERKGRIKPINGVKNYLNSNVNVDENPHDNFFLYNTHIGCVKHIYRNIGDSGIVFTFDKVNREILKWVLNQNT